jgi:hypothetical protein
VSSVFSFLLEAKVCIAVRASLQTIVVSLFVIEAIVAMFLPSVCRCGTVRRLVLTYSTSETDGAEQAGRTSCKRFAKLENAPPRRLLVLMLTVQLVAFSLTLILL